MVPQQKPDRGDSPWYNSIFMKLKTSPVMCADRVPSVAVWHWDQVNHGLPEAQTSFGVVEVFCLDLGSGLSTVAFVKPHHTERLKVGRLYSCWTSDPSPSHTLQHHLLSSSCHEYRMGFTRPALQGTHQGCYHMATKVQSLQHSIDHSI